MQLVRFGRRRSTGARSGRCPDKRRPIERMCLQGKPRRWSQAVSYEPVSQCLEVRIHCSEGRTPPPFLDDDRLQCQTTVCLGIGQWTMAGDQLCRRRAQSTPPADFVAQSCFATPSGASGTSSAELQAESVDRARKMRRSSHTTEDFRIILSEIGAVSRSR